MYNFFLSANGDTGLGNAMRDEHQGEHTRNADLGMVWREADAIKHAKEKRDQFKDLFWDLR